LGLTFQTIDDALRAAFPGDGVLIAEVAPYGPAEEAGVEAGDVITAVGEATVTTPDAARAAIAAIQPGATVELALLRNRKPLTIVVRASSALGLRVRQTPRAPVGEAPVARALFSAEFLAAHDLLPDSRIITINGTRVRTTDDGRAQLRRARAPIVVYVEDARGRFFRALARPS
jgi:membrane-associated protease RseP (regulator of RpoE activity)